MLRRLAITGMAALLLFTTSSPVLAKTPVMHGRASLLMDGLTGQVLFQQNGIDHNFPASTTKLLTALVAVEHGRLDQVIKVSAKAIDQAPDSSSCYLDLGEEQRLEYLLYGLLLASGNDCAVAIAEGVSGGKPEEFVGWMNETARRVGATRSNFTNPHGLHDPNHFTTALDLALIARSALSNPTVLKIAGTREFNWPGKSNGTYYNHNALLFTYDGTIGGKTGFTEEARLTLVSAAQRSGRVLIGVVMGVDSKANQYNDLAALLNYGFDEFEQKVVVSAGSYQGNAPVISGKKETTAVVAQDSMVISVQKGNEPKITLGRSLDDNITAPVQAGQKLGVLEVWEGEKLVGTVPVTASESVQARPPILETALHWLISFLKWISIAVAGLFLFRTAVKGIRRALRFARKRQQIGTRPATSSQNTGVISSYRVRNRS